VDLTQWYSPVSGGIRTYLRAKAEWAGQHGHAHAAVVTGPREGVEMVGESRFESVRGFSPSRSWGYRVAPRAAPVIAALDRLEPSIVVIHDALAFPASVARWAAERGVRVAMLCHSDLSLGATGLPALVRRPAMATLGFAQRRALRAPSTILVASETSRNRIAAPAGVSVVTSPLGVDLDAFARAQPDPALRARLAPPGAALLLYAGRISSEKRVDLLPPALHALGGSAVLVVAGAGAAAGALVRAARRLGVDRRLVLIGHIADRSHLATLMATADCFVHPNPTEPFGLCPLEALASGCRVVAPDAAGTAELLRGRGAVLVAPDDPYAIAQGIRDALAAPRPRPDLSDLAWDRTFAREWGVYEALAVAA
jgi:alpha-1,6-mannosyltransferase